MRTLLYILLASVVCFSANSTAQYSSASDSASPYAKVFGLFVGQSPEAVEEYMQNVFGIPAENYESYMMPDAEPDAAQMIIEVPATTVSIPFVSDDEPTKVEIHSIEIYFTYKYPLADPPELGAHYFAIRYIDKPEIEEKLMAHVMEAYGEPVIDNKYGLQWCNYLSEEGDACITSCESRDSHPCPSNPAVGLGEYFNGVRALGLADWSATSNYKGAIR